MKRKLAVALLTLLPLYAGADTYDDMMNAVKLGDTPAVVALLKRGVDVDTTDREGNSLLMLAARDGRLELVDIFLGQRPKVNFRNSAGDTALRLAAFNGHQAIVEKLIAAGAHVNMSGWTPLIYAAFNGHTEIARILMKAGAQVNAASENGMTALMAAARGGHLATAKALLDAQADPNRKTDSGETALDIALKSKNTDLADMLRRAGGHAGKSLTIELK